MPISSTSSTSTASTACRVPTGSVSSVHFKRQTDAEHDEVIAVGGLHILGTERHEARRIDNQLRGRAGRQGDPGSSRFYLSLEDDLMRIFGSDRIAGLMQRLGMEEGVPIEHGMVTRAIERAQKQVEAQNFAVRKHLLEYDDVMNKQRESVYTLRREVLEGKVHISDEDVVDTRGYVLALAEDILDDQVDRFVGKQTEPEDWDLEAFKREVERIFDLDAENARRARTGREEQRRDRRRGLGSRQGELSGAHRQCRRRPFRARGPRSHAPVRRPAVEGPSLLSRPSEGRHRPCAATGSATRLSSTRKRASRCFRT
jgi:preprotein translocase subunit SecA